ncbi:hypothetical protein Patl1_11631 [Pistacia atlantica]|uniref:Uncharacterized protein n=1 Tax=Pistacia atlantica TaxID=434234 RepID=A0ACC1A4X4_9ROSI|nr:hypothetical protein Patl1_11631 [Pistacia atlantica]
MCDYGLFGGEVKPELLNPGPKGKVEMKSKEGAKLGSEGTIGAVKLHATCCNGLGLLNVGSGSGKILAMLATLNCLLVLAFYLSLKVVGKSGQEVFQMTLSMAFLGHHSTSVEKLLLRESYKER